MLADYDRVACALCAVRDSMVAKIRADGRETLRRLCDAASLELQMPCLLVGVALSHVRLRRDPPHGRVRACSITQLRSATSLECIWGP